MWAAPSLCFEEVWWCENGEGIWQEASLHMAACVVHHELLRYGSVLRMW
jgi:hypothetical protein